MDIETQKQIAKKWDNLHTVSRRTRWWQSPRIVRHINKNICGNELDGVGQGLIEVLKRNSKSLPHGRGLSIGCGTAAKEFNLLAQGIVHHFDLYEFSPQRIRIIEENTVAQGLQDRITIHQTDFFATASPKQYDFVHWDNSLHHMFDVMTAIKTSCDVLNPGGVFYMNDYVGPSRFQWPDIQLEYINRFRKALPDHLFFDHEHGRRWPKERNRPSLTAMIADDPSEAADSANILPSLKAVFPDAAILPTGGVIYHVGLNDVLVNIPEDSEYLDLALLIDDLCNKLGQYHYAVALAFK